MSTTYERSKGAYDAIRKQGGSIFNHRGDNVSGSAYGWQSFDRYMNELCGSDPGMTGDALQAIEDAAKQAAWIDEANQLPLTDPKCHSKPMIHLHVGCSVTVEMTARNKGEMDCS